MTLAGNNIKVKIWRILYANDDSVGGAVVTGTYIGSYPARLQANPEEQILMQQGLETERTFKINIVPGYLDIRERDELTVIAPTDHVYYNKWFRVRGVSYSSLNKRDPRNYMMLTVSISVRAHSDDAVLQEGTTVATTTTTATTLYDRIVALSPTVFNPLGDASSPLADVMGNNGTFDAGGLLNFRQAGIGDGNLSIRFYTGSYAKSSSAYDSLVVPDSKFSGYLWVKFISPSLANNNSYTTINFDFYNGSDTYFGIEKALTANTLNFTYPNNVFPPAKVISMPVDYNWHVYVWTLDYALSRFRGYCDGILIGEVNSLNSVGLGAYSFLGWDGSTSDAKLNAYLQYHAIWVNKELTQNEITGISTI
jgi:hypothetical protein